MRRSASIFLWAVITQDATTAFQTPSFRVTSNKVPTDHKLSPRSSESDHLHLDPLEEMDGVDGKRNALTVWRKKIESSLSAASVATLIFLSTLALVPAPLPSMAASYGSLTEEQKLVAEAWRLVDNSFLDRTFNGVDWFSLRQDYVNKRKYKSMDEARVAIDSMVSTLGDKYTRTLKVS